MRIHGIALKRFGIIISGLSLTILLFLLWQMRVYVKPTKSLSEEIVDYDHVDVTITDIIACADQYNEVFLNEENTCYLYVVEVDNSSLVLYESNIDTISKLQHQIPMRVNGIAYVVKGEKLQKVNTLLSGYLQEQTFYPYQIENIVYQPVLCVVLFALFLSGVASFVYGCKKMKT